jgi:hypothetical protein
MTRSTRKEVTAGKEIAGREGLEARRRSRAEKEDEKILT